MTEQCKECEHNLPEEEPQGEWYTIMGVGINGVEMLHSGMNFAEASERTEIMSLRARFNSHRAIQVFTWKDEEEVTYERLENARFLAEVISKATKIY